MRRTQMVLGPAPPFLDWVPATPVVPCESMVYGESKGRESLMRPLLLAPREGGPRSS